MGKEKSRSRNNSFQFCFFYVCKTQQEKANILHIHPEAHHPFHGKSYLEYFQFLVSLQISWSLLLISIINLVSIWASHLCRLALLCPLRLKNHRVDIMEIENLKWYCDENHIFPIQPILKHKQVACMTRKVLFTIFKYLFSFQRYLSF